MTNLGCCEPPTSSLVCPGHTFELDAYPTRDWELPGSSEDAVYVASEPLRTAEDSLSLTRFRGHLPKADHPIRSRTCARWRPDVLLLTV
jgi:hypothetical protein